MCHGCGQIDGNCTSCRRDDSSGVCLSCGNGYYLDSDGRRCVTCGSIGGCGSCSHSSNRCVSCSDGYYLDNDGRRCFACGEITGCVECSPVSRQCTRCSSEGVSGGY